MNDTTQSHRSNVERLKSEMQEHVNRCVELSKVMPKDRCPPVYQRSFSQSGLMHGLRQWGKDEAPTEEVAKRKVNKLLLGHRWDDTPKFTDARDGARAIWDLMRTRSCADEKYYEEREWAVDGQVRRMQTKHSRNISSL